MPSISSLYRGSYSGISGYSGNSGYSGTNGTNGTSGYSGISGYSGNSGYSGISGYSGWSGISGYSGKSGYSGTNGTNGTSGYSGISGYSGALTTNSNAQVNSLGVGTAASTVAGEIQATGNITAYYSDERLKTILGNISGAVDKVKKLNGFYYEPNEVAKELGYEYKREVGVSAQQVQNVLPEIVVPAPIDKNYLTVHYEKLIPLLIEAIKEQQIRIELLEQKINGNS